MLLIQFPILLFEIFPFFLTLVLFLPINKYKILKTKEDQLFLQKSIITTIFFLIEIIVGILKIVIPDLSILTIIQAFIYNIYINSIIFYNFFLCLEIYRTYTNPVHLFNRLFKQSKNNYVPEILIGVFTGLSFVFNLVSYFVFDFNVAYKNKHTDLIMPNFYNFGIISFFSLISALICFIKKSKIKKFCFKGQEKLINMLQKNTISNLLYFIYGVYYSIPFLLDTKSEDIMVIFNTIGGFLIILIIIMDLMVQITLLASTKFCEYRLKKTIIGFICSLFYKPSKNEESMIPLINNTIETDSSLEAGDESSMVNNETTMNEIVSNSPKDKELVSMYKNGIFIEDYFMNFFDQILNILTLSLFQVYNSKHFSSKANDLRLSTDMKIEQDVSGIGGGGYGNMSTSGVGVDLSDAKCQVGDNTISFKIKKNMEKDDYAKFKDVLETGLNIENDNNYINTEVKSYFTPRCVETIFDQRIKGRHVGNSLLSHMILPNSKNKNMDNPSATFWGLTASNGKEEYFNKLKNTCIKTYDKNFNLEIFDSNDDEIVLKQNGKSSDISVLLDKYFTYIHAKGINGTFIPSLVGVFKVKINNFKTLLVFVTRNSLVENIPKNFFTYWQLIRFLNDKPLKLASSQFNNEGKTLVKDDPIFERLFQVQTQNENPDFNKIMVKDFSGFKETIRSDFDFLNKCGCHNFDLLLMYYEYENTQKHEKQGAIKIKKVNGDKAEIVQASMPQGMLDPDLASPASNFPGSSLGGGMFSLGGAFLDGGEDEKGGADPIVIKQNAANLMDYSEKFNINGYEGVFDSFNCMCFFTFENIFDIRKRLGLKEDFYTDFQNKILMNFTNAKN